MQINGFQMYDNLALRVPTAVVTSLSVVLLSCEEMPGTGSKALPEGTGYYCGNTQL